MSLLPLLGLLTSAWAIDDIPCPKDVSIRALKKQNNSLQAQILAQVTDANALDGAVVQAHMLMGCVRNVPMSVISRSFLLLGTHHMAQGDDFQGEPFIAAAALLGGESAWVEGLSAEIRTRYFNTLTDPRQRGVVYAPEFRLPGGYHLVGASGGPPWTMPIGTFTFEWGERSVPVNVNDRELTLVLPSTFDDFDALVEGVTESDLEEPDYDAIVYYNTRRQERQARRETQRVAEQHSASTQEQDQEQPPPSEGPLVDADELFDELATYEGEEGEAPPPPPDDEPPSLRIRTGPALAFRPHLGAGAAWTITGSPGKGAVVGDEDFGGLGIQLGLGLKLSLGQHFGLRPELGFRSAGTSAELGAGRFADEGYDGEVPVEPLKNHLWLGYGRLPLLLQLGPLAVGAGPAWSMGRAQVTGLTSCGDEALDCIAPSKGTVMAAGGAAHLGFRPGRSPVLPWIDVSYLSDGERPYIGASLSIAWEGKP